MCVPYMKERAESLSNYVLSETPNVTIMVDDEMNIIEFNKAAAERMFSISRQEALEKGVVRADRQLRLPVCFGDQAADHQQEGAL